MAGIISRITNFLRSPMGRKIVDTATRMARDPDNQRKAKEALKKLRQKRRQR